MPAGEAPAQPAARAKATQTPATGTSNSRLQPTAAVEPRAQPTGQGPRSAEGPHSSQLAATVPPAARHHYELSAQAKGIIVRGTAVLELRHDGNSYDAQLVVTSPFLRTRTQRSAGAVTASGFAPQRFSDQSRSEEAVHFDRDASQIIFSTNKPAAPLDPGAQDRLSVILQLGALLAAAPSRYPPGATITIQTASARDAEPWTFVVESMQTLDLPGGVVPALYLTRAPRREFDVNVELWLAPGATYAPVRLRLTQPNGDWVDQQWSSTDRG